MTLGELITTLAKIPAEYRDCVVVCDEEGTMRRIGPVTVCEADFSDHTLVVNLSGWRADVIVWREAQS